MHAYVTACELQVGDDVIENGETFRVIESRPAHHGLHWVLQLEDKNRTAHPRLVSRMRRYEYADPEKRRISP